MMEEVAGLLKRTREEKGLSLKDTEAKTRIPFHYLQILEGEGNTRLLADTLYLIPFLRAYSAFLGLDPALTVSQFVAAVQKGEPQGPVSPSKPRRLFSRTLFVLVILAGLVVLSLLWISREPGG
jgi:cytoskeletal protein RodZ